MLAHSPRLAAFASILALGCTAVTGDPSAGPGDPRADGFEPAVETCAVAPDAYIGGDASGAECPDYWVCETLADDSGKQCDNPGPDYPDSGTWECWDEGGSTYCRGDYYPDSGGDGEWDCESQGEFVVCRDDTPDYPPGGSEDEWDCFYAQGHRVCSPATRLRGSRAAASTA